MTKQQILDRINLLASEIDANDEENRLMQAEISQLYAKVDAGDYEQQDEQAALGNHN